MDIFEVNAILLDHYFGNFTTSLIHKSLFEKYGMFNESEFLLVNDYDLWLRFTIFHGVQLHLVPKILAKYRQQTESVTQKNLDRMISDALKLQETIMSQIDPRLLSKYLQTLEQYRKKRPPENKDMPTIKEIIKALLQSVRNRYFQYLFNKKEKSGLNKFIKNPNLTRIGFLWIFNRKEFKYGFRKISKQN